MILYNNLDVVQSQYILDQWSMQNSIVLIQFCDSFIVCSHVDDLVLKFAQQDVAHALKTLNILIKFIEFA